MYVVNQLSILPPFSPLLICWWHTPNCPSPDPLLITTLATHHYRRVMTFIIDSLTIHSIYYGFRDRGDWKVLLV